MRRPIGPSVRLYRSQEHASEPVCIWEFVDELERGRAPRCALHAGRLPARNGGAKERNNVQKATQLRSILVLSLAAIATLILVSARPLAAETNAFTLTTQVDPPGSGTVNVNPGPP